jgi:hypothetical protein
VQLDEVTPAPLSLDTNNSVFSLTEANGRFIIVVTELRVRAHSSFTLLRAQSVIIAAVVPFRGSRYRFEGIISVRMQMLLGTADINRKLPVKYPEHT